MVLLAGRSKKAREAFGKTSLKWSIIVEKCQMKGYALTAEDVIDMKKAANTICLAEHANGIKTAAAYTCMSLRRTMAFLLPVLYLNFL